MNALNPLLLLTICLAGQTLVVATVSDSTNRVLARLNNRDKCEVPTYQEVDQLAEDFKQLNEAELGDDQRIAKETVLFQWHSFQKYLNEKTVTKSAKKRSFLGKVIEYQTQKYGVSICQRERDGELDQAEDADADDDEYQHNPLVRYAKRMRSGQYASGRDPNSSANRSYPYSHGEKSNSLNGDESVQFKSDTGFQVEDFAAKNAHVGPFTQDTEHDHPAAASRGRQYNGRITYSSNKNPKRITVHIHQK